jgi:putative restriction endonuclease
MPLLLLVILDLAQDKQLPDEDLPLTPELAFRFCSYSRIVAHRRKQRPDIRYPFYHLKSRGFWSPLKADKTPAEHRLEARYARMPSDFVAFVRDPAFREKARRLLIAKYFPDSAERMSLYTLTALPIPTDEQIATDAKEKSPNDAEKQGREVRFRLTVVGAYNYTCALTGYRLTTINGASIVDAAHIHQFAHSRNNDPRNGIALCKNAHWLFDNGLWTLTDDYRVIVAEGQFAEAGADQKLLGQYHGQKIHLPADAGLCPNPLHLAWHRSKKFKRP